MKQEKTSYRKKWVRNCLNVFSALAVMIMVFAYIHSAYA